MSNKVRDRQVLAIAALAFTGGLGGGVVFPILPLVGMQLGIPAAVVGLILSLNRITRLAVNPLTGILIDRIGARLPLTFGLLVEGGATLCFYAGVHGGNATAWFLAGRALWGVGSSLLMVGALTAALVFSGPGARGLATAKVRMSLTTGMPAGLVLGGVIAARYSAGAAFVTAAAITFVGVLIAWRYAPAGSARKTPSAATVAPDTAPTLRQLLGNRTLWNIWAFNFFVFFSVQGVILASLVLLVHSRHLVLPGWGVEGSAGALMALMIGSSALVSWWIGRHVDRTRRKAGAIMGGALMLIGGFVILAFSEKPGYAAIALMLVGAGTASINVPLILLIGELVPAAAYGRAFGIYQVWGDLGGSLGPIVGLEAVQRIGGTGALLAVTTLLTITLPLAVLLWLRERRRSIARPA